MAKITSGGMVMGVLLFIVPGYGFYDWLAGTQETYQSNIQESNHLDWATAQTAPVDSEEAFRRAQECAIATIGDTPAKTLFNRQFYLGNEETTQLYEGRYFCALDGSTIRLMNGKPSEPVKLDPEKLPEYHELLVNHHNVPVEHILAFNAEENSND
jgi:hypothetical protein